MTNKLFGTEKNNPAARNSHAADVSEILSGINDEDMKIALAVRNAIPAIERVVTRAVDAIQHGGHVVYIGAGTSGRLGVLDASEMPPTYGVEPDMIQGIIAGGYDALHHAGEGAEDDAEAGIRDTAHLTKDDILIGISASGSAVYVREAIKVARARGIYTAAICTAPDAPLLADAECAILADTGAEYVAGSTRMKSGTAQKLILNMISTAIMIRLGKVYAGYMIDVKISNIKLRQRAIKMIATLSGCALERAETIVSAIESDTITPVKPGVVMALENIDYAQAVALLKQHNNRIDTIMTKHGRDNFSE